MYRVKFECDLLGDHTAPILELVEKDELIFNNAFDFVTKEDLLYFTLFAFEQLKIDTESVEVKVYGSISEEDENYKILYDYIRNIEFGNRPNELEFTSEFDTIQEHQYFGLFCQLLCE